MRRCGRTTILLVAGLLASAAGAQTKQELEARRAESEAALAAIASQEGEVLAALDALEQNLAIERAAVTAAERRVEEAEAALKGVREDQATIRARLSRRTESLGPRLVARYKLGRAGYLPMLLSSGSIEELLRRRRLLTWIIRSDVEAMTEIRALRARLKEQETALETRAAELETLRASAATRLEAMKKTHAERAKALATIQGERSRHEQLLSELAAAQKALDARLARMAKRPARPRKAATGFAALEGRLPRPTVGAIELGFGPHTDPKYDTSTINNGVDIRAPRGAKVKAVSEGTVVHADWLRGYGNLVILDHGGGFHTLMAHLDTMTVKKGDEVPAGMVIGRVGDSGSLKGAHLYFEIRRKGRAVDPAKWFK